MHKHHIHQDSSTMVSLFMLLIPICGMGIDIYTPALPSMSQYFITSHFWVKFSIAIYLFGFAFGQLIIGPLSDQYGRRNILLGSLLSFSVFSGATIRVADTTKPLLFHLKDNIKKIYDNRSFAKELKKKKFFLADRKRIIEYFFYKLDNDAYKRFWKALN